MKKVIKFSILVFLMSTSMVFANGFSPVEDFPKAMTQIKEYLTNCIVEDKFENVNTVRVYFTVNSDGEIVILDVSTKDNEVKNHIKDRLDRVQLTQGDLIIGKIYAFAVVFK
ncbi:MAG: hypothetical protein QM535_08000 [Limnohabitans sp.]|nr:hypothetical protein [Limnohabitans sp.]